jgi:hypothetical protein
MAHEPREGVKPLQHSAAIADGKTIIKSVISHQKLLAEIEARNPIIANRRATNPLGAPAPPTTHDKE